MMDKYWPTFAVISASSGKIAGIQQKKVALDLGEWNKFVKFLVYIDGKVRQQHCKNEQVEPMPPTGIKRNLQSAFGGEDD